MRDIPLQERRKRYQGLSEALQNALFSDKSADAVEKAAVFADIEDRVRRLALLTGYVLIGYLNPLNFKDELTEEFELSDEVANQVAHQLDVEIFSLVEADLRKLYPPTIKTPTVTSGGFAGPALQKEEPKHEAKTQISEFEKRFLKHKVQVEPETPVVSKHEEPKKEIEPPKPKVEEKKTEVAPKGIERKITINAPKIEIVQTAPVKPEHNIQEEKSLFKKELKPIEEKEEEKDAFPHIRPVVPLPTFMQSQFQPSQPPKPKVESAYKEKVSPEDLGQLNKQEQENKPAPKLSGNVIDLRDL